MTAPVRTLLEQVFTSSSDNWRFKLIKNWDTIIGPLHKHMRLDRVDGDTLILGVYDVHWMHELYMLSRTITRTINTAIGSPHVKHVRFRLVERRQPISQHENKDPYVVVNSRSLTMRENRALENIPDEQLKEALRAFLLKTIGG